MIGGFPNNDLFKSLDRRHSALLRGTFPLFVSCLHFPLAKIVFSAAKTVFRARHMRPQPFHCYRQPNGRSKPKRALAHIAEKFDLRDVQRE